MKIMHCPQRMGENLARNLATVRQLRPLSVGFTELDLGPKDATAALTQGLPDHEILAPDRGEHSREVPIALRRGPATDLERVELIKLSRDIPGGGIGNDRWMNIVRFTHRGHPYFHVATHWNAAIQDPATGKMKKNERVEATVTASQRLVTEVGELIAEGREGWVTGDFNYRVHRKPGFRLWEHSPQTCFTTLGMTWFADGLDYLAWTSGLASRAGKGVESIAPGTAGNGSDHPWLVGRFTRAAG
jgi:hypothetical protein